MNILKFYVIVDLFFKIDKRTIFFGKPSHRAASRSLIATSIGAIGYSLSFYFSLKHCSNICASTDTPT